MEEQMLKECPLDFSLVGQKYWKEGDDFVWSCFPQQTSGWSWSLHLPEKSIWIPLSYFIKSIGLSWHHDCRGLSGLQYPVQRNLWCVDQEMFRTASEHLAQTGDSCPPVRQIPCRNWKVRIYHSQRDTKKTDTVWCSYFYRSRVKSLLYFHWCL